MKLFIKLNNWIENHGISEGQYKLFIQIFYLALFMRGFSLSGRIRFGQWDTANWLWPVSWLGDSNGFPIFAVLLFLFLIFTGVVIFNPFSRIFKFAAFVSFFLLLSMNYSFGHIEGEHHGLLYAALLFCFIGKHQRSSFRTSVLLAQLCLVFTYFNSGLWKLREWIPELLNPDRVTPIKPFAHQIAIQLNKGHPTNGFINWVLDWSPVFDGLVWLGVIIFELGLVVLPFFLGFHLLGGVLIVTFHLLSHIFVGVHYYSAAFSAVILFCVSSLIFKSQKLDSEGDTK